MHIFLYSRSVTCLTADAQLAQQGKLVDAKDVAVARKSLHGSPAKPTPPPSLHAAAPVTLKALPLPEPDARSRAERVKRFLAEEEARSERRQIKHTKQRAGSPDKRR